MGLTKICTGMLSVQGHVDVAQYLMKVQFRNQSSGFLKSLGAQLHNRALFIAALVQVFLSFVVVAYVRWWLALLLCLIVIPFTVFRTFYALCMRGNYRNPYYMGYFCGSFAVTLYCCLFRVFPALWEEQALQCVLMFSLTMLMTYYFVKYATGYSFCCCAPWRGLLVAC